MSDRNLSSLYSYVTILVKGAWLSLFCLKRHALQLFVMPWWARAYSNLLVCLSLANQRILSACMHEQGDILTNFNFQILICFRVLL